MNQIQSLKIFGILSLVGLGFLFSCAKPSKMLTGIPSTTLNENTNRSIAGLRLVQTNWFLYRAEFGNEDWKISPAGYLAKRIHRDSENKIQWEEDYYYTGKTFRRNPDSPTDWEMLTIHYDYITKALDIEYVGDDAAVLALLSRITSSSTDKDKFSVADEILHGWEMQRL